MATGRPSLLKQVWSPDNKDPKRTYGEVIRDLLTIGNTVPDVCAHVGIAESTFYEWLRRGREEEARLRSNPKAKARAAEAVYLEFAENIARARASARLAAVTTLRSAFRNMDEREVRVETFTETRLRKGKGGEQIPYVYKHERIIETKRERPGDWRAAIDYLKRRDPEHWSDRIQIDDWRTDAIRGIQAGEIGYAELAETFGDESLARQLFIEAGVEISIADGEGDAS